jgi:hypothetical protein
MVQHKTSHGVENEAGKHNQPATQKVGEAGAVAVAPVGFQPAVLKKSHLFKVHK